VTAIEGRWIWVSLPQATFAIITHHGKVVEAAPIAQWLVGKDEREVAKYLRSKGAVFRPLDPYEASESTDMKDDDRRPQAG
jgi:hypothetical protein